MGEAARRRPNQSTTAPPHPGWLDQDWACCQKPPEAQGLPKSTGDAEESNEPGKEKERDSTWLEPLGPLAPEAVSAHLRSQSQRGRP